MKIYKIIIISVIVTGFTSCNSITSIVFGLRQPRPESQKSLISYGNRIGLNTNKDFYFIDTSDIDNIWNGAFPKAYIYSSSGDLIFYLSCFATGTSDLEYFFKQENHKKQSDTTYHIYGKDTIITIAPKFESINKYLTTKPDSSPEFYVVYYWSKAFGRLNKNNAASLEKFIEDHPEYSTSFVKINCDYLKDKGYKKEDVLN